MFSRADEEDVAAVAGSLRGKFGFEEEEEEKEGVLEVRDSTEKVRGGEEDEEAEDNLWTFDGGGTLGIGKLAEEASVLRMGSVDSLVEVVQSLETDLLPPPSEWVGEMGKTLEMAAEAAAEGVEVATAAAAATEEAEAAGAAAMREVERSSGLSSSALSISLLKSVCLRYCMAGRRKASSGLSGTKKQTSSDLAGRSRMTSKTGSPVAPLAPTTLTASV